MTIVSQSPGGSGSGGVTSPTPSPGAVVLLSASSSTEYTTITAALAAASSGDVVMVGSGDWSESVTVPDGVRLVGYPITTSVSILGADTTSTRVTLGAGCTLREILVKGPSSGSNPNVTANHASGGTILFSVRLEADGGSGAMIQKTGAGALICQLVGFNAGTTTGAILDASAGLVRIVGGGINANAGTAAEFLKFTGTVTVEGQLAQVGPPMNLADVLHIGGTAQVGLANLTTPNDGAGTVTNGLRIVADGVTVDLNGCVFRADTYDFLVDSGLTGSGSNVTLIGMEFEKGKSSFPATWDPDLLLVSYADRGESGDNPGLKFVGVVDIGTPQFPASFSAGEGDSSILGMVAYTLDDSSGTFTDVTSDVTTGGDGNTAAWGTDADDALYIGFNENFKPRAYDLENVVALNGTLAVEVLTGTGPEVWTGINYMSGLSGTSTSYAKSVFARASGDENMRLNTEGSAWSSWTAGDPPSTGTDRYWLRVRNDGAITTSPTVDRVKVGTSWIEEKNTGTARFGESEELRTFWEGNGEMMSAPNGGANNPNNADITISTNVSYRQASSQYASGQNNRAGTQLEVPRGIDTGRPATFALVWTTSGTDTAAVKWDLYVTEVQIGDVLNSTTTERAVITNSVAPSGTANTVYKTTFDADISDLVPGDEIAFMLWRNGSGGGSDSNSNAAIALSLAWEAYFYD